MQWLHENCIHVKKPPNLLKIARFGGYIYLYNHVTSDKFIIYYEATANFLASFRLAKA